MSDAFIDPVALGIRCTSVHDDPTRELVNQIRLAWSERRQAIGQSALDDLSFGKLASEVTTGGISTTHFNIKSMQAWLEDKCVEFVNHEETIVGESSVTMFTVETWREVAGIHEDGFRRFNDDEWDGTTDPEYEYGIAEKGDIRGFWIYDDLIKGLSALKWAIYNYDDSRYAEAASGPDDREGKATDSDCDDARTDAQTAWDDGWETGSGTLNSYYYVFRYASAGTTFWGFRRRSTPQMTIDLVADREFDWDFYVKPIGDDDLDGYGFIDNQLFLWDSGTDATEALVVVDEIGNIDTNPIDIAPALSCPISSTTSEQLNIQQTLVYWIIKWDFTNSN